MKEAVVADGCLDLMQIYKALAQTADFWSVSMELRHWNDGQVSKPSGHRLYVRAQHHHYILLPAQNIIDIIIT